jgi:hypothetical protein
MEETSESQRQEILRKRQEMFKKMGVQNAGKLVTESVVNTGSPQSGMAARLAALKKGAAKQEFNKFINATAKGGSSADNGFQIPETKARTNPNANPNQKKQEVDPAHKQHIESFGAAPAANGQELNAIEALFGGGDSPRASSASMGSNMITNNPVDLNLDIETTNFPTFNPHAAIQKAKEKSQQTQSPYLKYASEGAVSNGNEEFVEAGAISQPNINVAMMQTMMETIAKGIAEKTIRNVLNEYTQQQQKGKNYFEYYNKEKNIIKTPDGKFFRLTQVELKKKS